MKVASRRPFVNTLPADDDHRYRSGAWRPQDTEYDAWNLEVEGEIPEALEGVYLRNTENPLMPSIGTYHPFDGDGMLHSIAFSNGEAVYRNRFIRTDAMLLEQYHGEALWCGLAGQPRDSKRASAIGARPRTKDASSTDVVVHRGQALTSFYLCGDLYRHDPVTLEPSGVETWGGDFPADGASAHTKIDPATGEMLFFNYGLDAPHMHYGVVDAEGKLAHYTDVPLPGPRLPHDMAFTTNYAILNDFPMIWDEGAMAAGYYVPGFHADLPSRFAVIPRRGNADDIMWFEADPTYVLHWINAYEDGDEIVLDGFFEEDPTPSPEPGDSLEDMVYRYLDLERMRSRAHRCTGDPRCHSCSVGRPRALSARRRDCLQQRRMAMERGHRRRRRTLLPNSKPLDAEQTLRPRRRLYPQVGSGTLGRFPKRALQAPRRGLLPRPQLSRAHRRSLGRTGRDARPLQEARRATTLG